MVDKDTIRIEAMSPASALDELAAAVTLVLYHEGGSMPVTLREGQSVEIGRSPPCAVVIPDDSLSRRHARVRLLHGALFVADLQSTNGTKIGDRHVVEETAFASSDVVTLGTVALRVAHARAERERQLEGYDSFRQHVDDEIVRSLHFHNTRSAAVLALRIAGGGPIVAVAHERLAGALRPIDRMALYSPDVALVLLPETTDAETTAVLDKVTSSSSRPRVIAGMATHPAHGTAADELIDLARAALRRATIDAPVQQPQRGARRIGNDDGAEGAGGVATVVVESPAMRALYDDVARVKKSSAAVLLHGETGSGKEVVARALHEGGPRADKPLLTVNCGAIPANLVESELFGHEKGAFTGADKLHVGLFESAQGGTVFLDEIGELPLEHQPKLLRALEKKAIRRVGGAKEIPIDVRIVSASHRDLEQMVADGTFREDLFFRLNVFQLAIPPLRERREEIVPLAELFLRDAAREAGRGVPAIADDVAEILRAYAWPGNVRELKNAMERAAAFAEDVVVPSDLPERVRRLASVGSAPHSSSSSSSSSQTITSAATIDLRTEVRRFEAGLIRDALQACGNNQKLAAERLGLPLRTLAYKVKDFRESGEL